MTTTLASRRDTLIAEIKSAIDTHGETMPTDVYRGVMEKKEELDDVVEKIADGERKAANIRALGQLNFSNDTPGDKAAAAEKSLGEHFVKNVSEADLKAMADHLKREFSVAEWGVKAASDPAMTGSLSDEFRDGFGTTWNRSIVNQRRERLVAADLMGSATVTNPVIKYLVEKATRLIEGAPATVAEGAAKPYVRFDSFDVLTETLAKIAALTKISDEMIEDFGFVADYINSQLIYELSVVEEQQLLNGDGTGNNLTGLLKREGLQVHNITSTTSGDQFDGLFEAMQKVPLATNLTADAMAINPVDYIRLRLAKDANGQYIAGGPFQGQYGNGGILVNPPVWGLRTIDTNAVPIGSYVLGAFRQGATVLRKGGIRVDATNLNDKDFENNLVTMRAEERLGLMVPLPAAFVTGTIGTEPKGA